MAGGLLMSVLWIAFMCLHLSLQDQPMECDPGQYGQNCEKQCSAGCPGGQCDHVTGRCKDYDCLPGWWPGYRRCDRACGHGRYGKGCSKLCNSGCMDGRCNHINGSCECWMGWTGQKCDVCPEDYYVHGRRCEKCSAGCQPGTCESDGVCTCLPGWSGRYCRTDINECQSSPCQNHGTCDDAVNSYTCTCGRGYTGLHCEEDINECESNPCQNGGTCENTHGSYTCHCPPGFRGYDCGQECGKGTYGQDCSGRCGEGCDGGECDKVTGHCQCRSIRWTGPKCDACTEGYYRTTVRQSSYPYTYIATCAQCGEGCEAGTCDASNGHCECQPGWTTRRPGKTCDHNCEDGKFGDNCLKDCGRCAEGEVCDKTNGHCTACEPGWKPPLCSDKCEDGHYGQHCSGHCGHCQNDDVCDVAVGFCPAGCKDGFHGLRCDSPTQLDNTDKLYMVAGVSSTVVVVLLAVVAVLVYRSRRPRQAPRTKHRIADAKHEEAGAQGNSPDPELGGNLPRLPGEEDGTHSGATNRACSPRANARAGELPRLPGEEDGTYSNVISSACSARANAKARDLPRLPGEEDGTYSDATNRACSPSANARARDLPRLPGEEDGTYINVTSSACSPRADARAREVQPAAVTTATSAPPSKESGGVDSRRGRTPGRNKPLGGRGTPLRNREDQAFGFGRGHPRQKPQQAAAMANDPEEPAQASFPSFELAPIFSPHSIEDLAGDVPYEDVGFPARVLANYERPTAYVNTAEDPHLYEKS